MMTPVQALQADSATPKYRAITTGSEVEDTENDARLTANLWGVVSPEKV